MQEEPGNGREGKGGPHGANLVNPDGVKEVLLLQLGRGEHDVIEDSHGKVTQVSHHLLLQPQHIRIRVDPELGSQGL